MGRKIRYGFVACILGICSFGCASYASPSEEPLKPRNYQECVSEGGKVLKSYPVQCITSDGVRFIQDEGAFRPNQKTCKNTCGNGTCEQISCMALGCPCPETRASCPQDCG